MLCYVFIFLGRDVARLRLYTREAQKCLCLRLVMNKMIDHMLLLAPVPACPPRAGLELFCYPVLWWNQGNKLHVESITQRRSALRLYMRESQKYKYFISLYLYFFISLYFYILFPYFNYIDCWLICKTCFVPYRTIAKKQFLLYYKIITKLK